MEKKEEGDSSSSSTYDPYEYRTPYAPVNSTEAKIHLTCGFLNIGILAIPAAFQSFGVLSASLGLLLIGILMTYCLHMLVRSMYKMCCLLQEPYLSCDSCIKHALQHSSSLLEIPSSMISALVIILIIICQLSVSSIYVKFMGETTQQLVAYYWLDVNKLYVYAVLTVPLVLLNCIPTIKDMVYCSIIANLAFFISIGIILSYIIKDFPSIPDRESYKKIGEYPYFLGVAIFTTNALGTVLSLEANMWKPEKLTAKKGILNKIMTLFLPCCAAFGYVGSESYGENVKDNIVYNLPISDSWANIARILLVVDYFFAHPLITFAIVQLVWHSYLKMYFIHASLIREVLVHYVFRTTIVCITVIMALIDYDIGILTSMCGTVFISILGIIFPALLDMVVSWKDKKWVVCKDMLLISFGLFAFVTGVNQAMKVFSE